MKRQQARLRELREMPYQEYLESPEWQETRKAALKRAGGHCQLCSGKGTLNVHHNNYDNLGCEQEDDVITLCADCHSLFHRAGKLVKKGDDGEEGGREDQREENTPSLSLTSRAWVGGTAALVGMGLPAILHAPPPAALGGLLLAVVLAWKCPKVYQVMREEMLPPEAVRWIDQWVEQRRRRQQEEGDDIVDEWSGWDRLLGKHLNWPRREADEEEDDYEVDELDEAPEGSVFPVYDANETLRLGGVLSSGKRFDPHMNMLLGKGALLAGSQGTGKSNIIGLIAQCAGQCAMPLLIIDFKGEFYPLCEILPAGIRAVAAASLDGETEGYYGLTVENAPELARLIMEGVMVQGRIVQGPFQVIVDIPSFDGEDDEMALTVSALLNGLMDWGRDMRRRGFEPWPCLVITDEAHNFLPERQKLSAFAMKKPTESFAALTKAYSRIGNTGRSFGYTQIMATQRLPNIAKWSIANLQIKVILAHAEKNDLDACEEETGKMIDREEIKRLANGTGIVMGLTRDPITIQFDKQEARHISTTPTLERLREQFQPQPQTAHTSVRPAQQVTQRANGQTKDQKIDQIMSWWTDGRITDEQCLTMIGKLTGKSGETHVSAEDQSMGLVPQLRVVRPGGGTNRDAQFMRNGLEMRDRGLVPTGDEEGELERETDRFEKLPGTSPQVPIKRANALLEPVPTGPREQTFVPKGDDRMVPDARHNDLAHFYSQYKDVKKALSEIGLGNRYFNHASWVLEQRGLKARRA